MAKPSFKAKNDRVLRELVDYVYRDGDYDDGGPMDIVFWWAEYVNWLADEYKYRGQPIPEEERSKLVWQFPLPNWYVTAMVSRLAPAQKKETMRLYNKELASYGFTEVGPGRVANPAGCAMTSGRLSSRSGSGSRSNSRHNDEPSFTPSGRTSRMLRRRNPAVGPEFFTDTRPGKKFGKLLPAGVAAEMIPNSVNALAFASLKSDNRKTGPIYVTSSAQQSCPNGENNSYRCPFLNAGCYAEGGPQGVTTKRMNTTAGQAQADSLEIAKAEAAALDKLAGYLNTYQGGPSKMLRLHIVGDAVTTESAKILAEACQPFYRRSDRIDTLPGDGGAGVSKVWAYTHGWRNVPRSAWGDVSILASCETLEDLEQAHARGYACAAVVPDYDNAHLGARWKAYPKENGFIILPCPNEARPEKPTCDKCGLCLREDMLRSKKMVIAFATHGSKSKTVDVTLDKIGANI